MRTRRSPPPTPIRGSAVGADPGRRAAVAWAYSDFGPAGAVASRRHVDDLDITEVTFANGVRLNLKKTDFEADTIHVAARLGTGQLTEPASTEPGLSAFTGLTFSAGGLGRHSADDVKRILAGRKAGVRFASALDAFGLHGRHGQGGPRARVPAARGLRSPIPGYRPEAQRDARKRIEAEYMKFEHTGAARSPLQVPRLLAAATRASGCRPKRT